MGTAKDLIDLITQFSKRIKDRETLAELMPIQALAVQLQSENFQLQSEILELKRKLFESQNQKEQINQETKDQRVDDICPYCRRPALRLLEIKPHPLFHEVGVKTGYYQCDNCQKKYDREIQP